MESNLNTKSNVDNGNAGGTSTGDLETDDGEGQDEEPSSAASKQNMSSYELDDFRRKWQREIEILPANENASSTNESREPSPNELDETDVAIQIEEQARSYFLCGVQAERAGLLEKAISFYRRAVQLVPDIEFRVTDYSNDHTSNSYSDDSDDSSDRENVPFEVFNDTPVNLLEKFQNNLYSAETSTICLPKVEQNNFHISNLPPEIFIYILKWVVSNELDVLSLEQISKVCRGFYVCARDPEIWRLVCMRIWGVNIGSPNRFGSWRSMFVQRPHLSYNGAYISKTTYVRHGESTFCDANYRPYYVVEYFRYLRFFPEGLVLMLTTPDDPHQSLAKLRFRRSKYQSVLFGRFKLIGNTVVAALKKPKTDASSNYFRYRRPRQASLQEACDQTFHLELELKNVKKRTNFQLIWKRYSIHMIYRNGQETVSDFDLTPSNFPPFMFSRVKSYTAESESPLN